MPAAAKKNTAAGARAAALYFLDVYVYALHSGQSTQLAAMCTDLSEFCSNALASAQKVASGTSEIQGGEISARIVKTYERDSLTGAFALDLHVEQASLTLQQKHESTTYPRGVTTMRAELLYGHGTWHVLTLTPVGDSK